MVCGRDPFPPPARRAETASGEGYTNFLQKASTLSSHHLSANVKASARTEQHQHQQQRRNKLFHQPNERFNKVISSSPIKEKMQKIKKSKTLVDAAKIGAQTKIAFNYPHCCPICPASRFPTRDYEDVSDVPTVYQTLVQLEFKFACGCGHNRGKGRSGRSAWRMVRLMGNPVCPRGGGCVMCPNQRSQLPPFGEPFSRMSWSRKCLFSRINSKKVTIGGTW